MDADPRLDVLQGIESAAKYLQDLLPVALQAPRLGIVCGSGLGGLGRILNSTNKIEIPYGDVPHFPPSTVEGHSGRLLFGTIDTLPDALVLMQGRAHYYEGHSIYDVVFPIRVLASLGVKILVVTNAAGALNAAFEVGDITLLSDHLNLAGLAGIHPLRGPNLDHFGVRFPPLSNAYDLGLRRLAHRAWVRMGGANTGHTLHEGVYAFVGGPSFETRAECRALSLLGADLVGMSTVPEVIVARHSGVRVLALSIVTNKAQLMKGSPGNDPAIENMTREELEKLGTEGIAKHEEVLEVGQRAAEVVQDFVNHIAQDMLHSEMALNTS